MDQNEYTIVSSANVSKEEYLRILKSFGLNGAGWSLTSQLTIRRLHADGKVDKAVREYLANSKPDNLDIMNIWEVSDSTRWQKFVRKRFDKVDNYLLWHGTKRTNLCSILANGLRLPRADSNTSSVGPGIYFADRLHHSSKYADPYCPKVFLGCQVAVGRIHTLDQKKYLKKPPRTYHSIKVMGKMVPDESNGLKVIGDLMVPSGGTVANPCERPTLYFNEYVIYDPERVLVKYIVHCEKFEPPAKPIEAIEQVPTPKLVPLTYWTIPHGLTIDPEIEVSPQTAVPFPEAAKVLTESKPVLGVFCPDISVRYQPY